LAPRLRQPAKRHSPLSQGTMLSASLIHLGALQTRSWRPNYHASQHSGGQPPRLCDEKACIETPELVITTDPRAEPDMHCVMQEGLSMGGKPVWACATDAAGPSEPRKRAPPPAMSLAPVSGRRAVVAAVAAAAALGGQPSASLAAAGLDAPNLRILAARSTTTKLLEDEATFKTMIKVGLATDTLQLPPTLPFTMFKELEATVTDPGEFMDAAIEYVEYQRDAKDLLALAVLGRVNGAGSEAVQDYVDRSLLSVRGADKALQRMVPLLPA